MFHDHLHVNCFFRAGPGLHKNLCMLLSATILSPSCARCPHAFLNCNKRAHQSTRSYSSTSRPSLLHLLYQHTSYCLAHFSYPTILLQVHLFEYLHHLFCFIALNKHLLLLLPRPLYFSTQLLCSSNLQHPLS